MWVLGMEHPELRCHFHRLGSPKSRSFRQGFKSRHLGSLAQWLNVRNMATDSSWHSVRTHHTCHQEVEPLSAIFDLGWVCDLLWQIWRGKGGFLKLLRTHFRKPLLFSSRGCLTAKWRRPGRPLCLMIRDPRSTSWGSRLVTEDRFGILPPDELSDEDNLWRSQLALPVTEQLPAKPTGTKT